MSNTGNTQQIIDYGATANDGQGDPLRTAFIKTDENFANIWLAGPVGSNITIANNTIQTNNTNGNLILKPNGTGVIQANASAYPNMSDVRNLGAPDLRWRTLYVGIGGVNSTGTISTANLSVTGDLTIGGDATIEGNLVVEGDTIQIGNITTDTLLIQLANAAATDAAANGAGITVGANDDIATLLYDSANNAWTTNIGLQVGGPITGTTIAVSEATVYGNLNGVDGYFTGNVTANAFIGNGSQLTNIDANNINGLANIAYTGSWDDLVDVPTLYANANAAAYGEAGWAGNITPATSNLYSLGNSTHQWKSLYVSNTTIYINNVPISLTSGNVLTVDGQPILSNDSNTSISTTGNITADYFFGDGSQLTGIETSKIFNGTSNVEVATANGDVVITTDGTYQWNFAADGTTTFPNGLYFAPMGEIYQNAGTMILGSGDYDVQISANANGTGQTWGFGTDGNLTLPEGGVIAEQANPGGFPGYSTVIQPTGYINPNQKLLVYPTGGEDYNHLHLTSGNLWDTEIFLGNDELYVKLASTGNVEIRSDDAAGNAALWTFDRDGNLTAPGNIITSERVEGDVAFFNDVIVNNAGTNAFVFTNSNRELYDTNFDYDEANSMMTGSGTISISGNITAGYFFGDGSNLTGLPAQYGDSNVATFLAAYGSNTVSTTGNISAGNFIGSGTDVDIVAGSYEWTFDNGGNLTLPGNTFAVNYANGSAVNLSTYGNANVVANLAALSSNPISTTGNVTAGYFFGNASQLTSVNAATVDITNTNGLTTVYYPTFVENRSTAQIVRADVDLSYRTDTNTLTTGNLTSGGNITGGNLVTGGQVSATGNVTGGNVTTAGLVTATGNVTGGNVLTAGQVSATGNVIGNYILGNGALLTGVSSSSNSFSTVSANGTSVVADSTSDTITYTPGNNLIITGNATSDTVTFAVSDSPTFSGNVTAQNFSGNISITGNVTGTSSNVELIAGAYTWTFDNTGNLVLPANTFSVNYANGTAVSLGGGTYGNANVVANLAALSSNPISTTGNVTAGYFFGNISQATGGYGNANVVANLAALSSNPVSTTGNVTAGNIIITGNTTTGINAVTAGVNNTILPNTIASFSSNVNGYTQLTLENTNSGADATADFILTADNGTDTVNYGDFGIINSGYDVNTPTNSLGNIVYAADTYIYAQGNTSNTAQSGGNLVIGTTTATKNIKLFAGGANTSALIATVSNAGITMNSGNITGNTGGFAIGYRDIPQVTFSANATIATSDAGKHYYSTSASNLVMTIANNASQAFAIGAAINIINRGTGTMTIAQGSGVTLYLAGNTTSGNRTLASYGAATIQKVETDVWFVVGTGLT